MTVRVGYKRINQITVCYCSYRGSIVMIPDWQHSKAKKWEYNNPPRHLRGYHRPNESSIVPDMNLENIH